MRASPLIGFCAILFCLDGYVLAADGPTSAPAAANGEAVTAEQPPLVEGAPRARPVRQYQRRTPQQVIDGNVQRLSKALDLDAKQQGLLRTILESERDQVLTLRNGSAATAPDRVGALHAIVDHAREQIRAMLNDDQKKKYQNPVPQELTAPAQADTAHWLDLMHGAGAQSAKDAN